MIMEWGSKPKSISTIKKAKLHCKWENIYVKFLSLDKIAAIEWNIYIEVS